MKVTEMRLARVCAVALLIVNCIPALAQKNAPAGTPDGQLAADPSKYVIRPNDVLEIFVWKEPDLSRKSVVRPDGRISFPLLQDLDAAGLTPEQLKKVIEDQLKDYINSTNVTVMVDSVTGYVIYVVGKVQRPGAVTADKPITVLQALTLAGGFLEYAKDGEISVIRSGAKGNETFRFDYKSVIKGKTPAQNIFLRPGDVVVVP
jgi:polysaccharide export outer membrane protein